MRVLEGTSDKSDAYGAICEATDHWADEAFPDLLFVFHSSIQDPHIVATSLFERFPNTLIVGCTTAGEWLTGQQKTTHWYYWA